MVIGAVATLALYCSRCGKIHAHRLSRFVMNKDGQKELLCSCGQLQASIISVRRDQYLLSIPCVVCDAKHMICIDIKRFGCNGTDNGGGMIKLYCPEENIELGFAGSPAMVDAVIAEHEEEIKRMVHEIAESDYDYEEHIENPQVMFEMLNRVHELAEQGRVYCQCGSSDIEASIHAETIEIQCQRCGSVQTIAAKTEYDLARSELLHAIEIISPLLTHPTFRTP